MDRFRLDHHRRIEAGRQGDRGRLAKIFFPGAPVTLGDPNAPPPGAPGAPGKAGPPKGDAKGEAKKGGH
jgi:hypothetical protein